MRVLDHLPAALAVLIAVMATPVLSAATPAPTDPVVHNVSGLIANRNAENCAQFDLVGLQALPVAELVTTTAWTTDEAQFLIAYRMNGETMSVRDRGPLWVIYPVSQHPELAGPETEGKMIWQLRHIVAQ